MKPMSRYLAAVMTLCLTCLPPVHMGILKVPMQRRTRSLESYEKESCGQATGITDSDYYFTLQVGTPPKDFTVMLDTGTTGMWIPSAQCPAERYDMCKNRARYERGRSHTYRREGQMFGYGGMVGELSHDNVILGGANVSDQTFAEVFQYRYYDHSVPYDGVLGAGLGRVFSNETSIFVSMREQGLIQRTVFGVYFSKSSSDPRNAGGLVVGDSDRSAFHGDLTIVPSMYDHMWQFSFHDVRLMLSPEMPSLCPQGCTAVPRTSLHYILSDKNTISTLHKYLGGQPYMNNNYQFDCNKLDNLQPVLFHLENTYLELPWQSYVDRTIDSAGSMVCLSAFVATEDFTVSADAPTGWYLGDTFFTSVYVEYDLENRRMGFAQSVYSA